MVESMKEVFNNLPINLFESHNFYLVEAGLVFLGALFLDLFQRKTLNSLKEKAKRTKTIWDDVFLGALARPISIIIWISR